tara:strand:- start:853 stop:1002 length:150 start_codon:yes stop_codon:yes gene_type:complete
MTLNQSPKKRKKIEENCKKESFNELKLCAGIKTLLYSDKVLTSTNNLKK